MTEAAEKRNQQEFQENFDHLTNQIKKINRLKPGADNQDVIDAVTDAAAFLAKAYQFAEKTSGLDDNVDTRDMQRSLRETIDRKIAQGIMPAQAKSFFDAYTAYLRVTDLSRASEVQLRVAKGAMKDMTAAATAAGGAGWTELQDFFDTQVKTDLEQLLTDRQEEYDKNTLEVGRGDVLELLNSGFVEWDKLVNPVQNKPILALHDDLDQKVPRYAEIVTRPGGNNTLDDDQIQVLHTAISELRSDARVLRAHPEQVEQIRRLRAVIYRILHEDRVNKAGRGTDKRNFLRPSTKDIDDDVYGEMMMFLGDINGPAIDEVEAIGLILAFASEPSKALSPEQRRKLDKIQDRIQQVKQRYVSLRTGSGAVLEAGDIQYIKKLTKEIDKYLVWVQDLIDKSQETTVANVTRRGKDSANPKDYTLNDPNPDVRSDEWRRFIDNCLTTFELETAMRLIIKDIYFRDDVTESYNLSDKDKRIEFDLYRAWQARLEKIGESDPDRAQEMKRLDERYTNMLHLFDGAVKYGNLDSQTADILGNLDDLAASGRNNRITEFDLYYFNTEQRNLETGAPIPDPAVNDPNRKEVVRYEYSHIVKWAEARLEELQTEQMDPNNQYDPSEPYDPNNHKPGRFWAHNWGESSRHRNDAAAKLKLEIFANPAYGFDANNPSDDATVDDILSIVRAMGAFTGMRFDTNAEPLLRGLSPRHLLAGRLNHINEFFPFAGAAYSAYSAEKELEIFMATEIPHELEHSWRMPTDEDTPSMRKFKEVLTDNADGRWHMIEESQRGTRLFREQFAPYRKRWAITHLEQLDRKGNAVGERRVLKSPMPTLYQAFVANAEYSAARGFSFAGWVDAVKGYMTFQEAVMAEIKVKPGEDLAHTRVELVHKLEKALDTFSKIKNVNVDWGYITHMVLHLIDKIYFAYAEVDKSVEGSESLYELIVEKFGYLTLRRSLKKRIVSLSLKEPHPDTYIKGNPEATFIEDGVEWTSGDYIVTQLNARGVFWDWMARKRKNKGKPVDPVPAVPEWVDHDDEVLRRQPWDDRTTPRAIAAKAAYALFKAQHPTFHATVFEYGTGKSDSTKEVKDLDLKKKH